MESIHLGKTMQVNQILRKETSLKQRDKTRTKRRIWFLVTRGTQPQAYWEYNQGELKLKCSRELWTLPTSSLTSVRMIINYIIKIYTFLSFPFAGKKLIRNQDWEKANAHSLADCPEKQTRNRFFENQVRRVTPLSNSSHWPTVSTQLAHCALISYIRSSSPP